MFLVYDPVALNAIMNKRRLYSKNKAFVEEAKTASLCRYYII